MARKRLVECQATIHMPGISPGQIIRVDPTVDYIAMCIEQGYLVPVRELTTTVVKPT